VTSKVFRGFVLVMMATVVAACGGDGAGPETTASPGTTAAPDTTVAAAAPSTSDTVGEGLLGNDDLADVDWSSVDLTTIDWANIDLRLVDFEAIRDNPTAANLTEETTSLIQSRINPGHATLTVGDAVFEFEAFDCAFGHDATESAVYSFSSNSFGQYETSRVQMQANIRDESGEGRYEGEGLTHEVFLNDITDFENPIIGWEMMAPDGIVVDGYEISAEGVFDDLITSSVEETPGTLEATCSDLSRH
jgi:hypothetical protein